MIIVTRPDVTDQELTAILDRVSAAGLTGHVSRGERRVVIGCVGDEAALADFPLAALPGVESVTPVLRPYKLASREFSAAPDRATVVTLGRTLVAPLAFAAVAAGADGLLIEVHPAPSAARSDGEQSLTFAQFAELMHRLVAFAEAAGRTLELPVGGETGQAVAGTHAAAALAVA